MNRDYLYFTAVAIIAFFFIVQSSTNVTSSRGDRTGSPLSMGSCASCHNSGGFSPTIEIQLLDNQGNPVTEYIPEETYTVNVVLQENSAPGFGFQATALLSDNSQAGELNAVSTNVSEAMLNNVRYVEHPSPSGTGVFEMTWTAPPSGSGDVTFYSGGNAVDLQNGSLGDNGVTATPVTISEAEECIPPINLSTDAITTTTAEVSWEAGGDETEWNVYWGETGFDPQTQGEQSLGVTNTTIQLTDLNPETSYDVIIYSVCNDGESDSFSSTTFVTAGPDDCIAPSGLEANNITSTSADITWNPGADENEWNLLWGLSGFNPDTEGNPETLTTSSFTLTGLETSTTYDVYVQAICATDESEWTMIEFTTQATCPMPTDLTAVQVDENTIEVNWSQGGDEVEWNLIYVESGGDPDIDGTFENGLTTTTFNITDFTAGEAYDIYVESVCDDEVSMRAMVTISTSINAIHAQEDIHFKLFPNPVDTYLEVQFNQNTKKSIEIYSITGALMYSITNISDDQFTIDVHDLNSGIYFLKVHTGNRTTVKKFVKQ